MKFSTTFATLSLLSGANAFAPSSFERAKTTKLASAPEEMSEALPFQKRPHALDGTFAGDVGFDPIGFASDQESLWTYREAEIKHARLAMLAAAGWPLAELFDRKLANIIGAPAVVDASERSPSILNGGLGKVNPLYWIAVLGTAAAIDLKQNSLRESNDPNYKFPGDLSWDPLGLYPEDEAEQKRMRLAEIKNGRLAMIAITAFAFQEYVQGYAVVAQTPSFFKPVQDVVDTYGDMQIIDTHL